MNELKKETLEGGLYDYIAYHYYEMTPYKIKEILLSVLGVGLDQCHSEEDEKAYAKLIAEEMDERGLFD